MCIRDRVYIVFLALFAHIFRPDTGLYLTDMRLAQIEHKEAGLPYTAPDGKRQCIIHQEFYVEDELYLCHLCLRV